MKKGIQKFCLFTPCLLVAVFSYQIARAGFLDDLKREAQKALESVQSSTDSHQDQTSPPGSPGQKSGSGPNSFGAKSEIKLGQQAGSAADYSKRRQPLTGLYQHWLMAKFIPGMFDDKTLLGFVANEISYAKKYNASGGTVKPWLSYDEVKGRHPELAAPEFLGRYKTYIREFLDQLSLRVEGETRIGYPRYDLSTGMMNFTTKSDQRHVTRTDFVGQLYTQKNWRQLSGFGKKAVAKIAERTAGRQLGGVLGSYKKAHSKPKERMPLALRYRKSKSLSLMTAYDKNLTINGLPMTKSEAERFLNKYEQNNIQVRVRYTIQAAFQYFNQAYKIEGVIYLADVEDVEIYTQVRKVSKKNQVHLEKKVIARFKARDFMKPKVTVASLKARHEAKIRAKQGQSARRKQSLLAEITALKSTCAATREPKCYQKLCGRVKQLGNDREARACRKQWQQASIDKSRAGLEASKRSYTDSLKKKAETDRKLVGNKQIAYACQSRYGGNNAKPWMPLAGTPQYRAALAACVTEPIRKPYGPDVLGLRLGMSDNDTRNLMQRQQMRFSADLNVTQPFEKGRLYWTEEASHGIALFFFTNGNAINKRVAAISRRLYLGNQDVTTGQVTDRLRDKYGKETWSNGKDTLLWASKSMCSGLTKLVEPRAGWNREWGAKTGRRAPRKRRERRERRAARSAAMMGAYSECVSKFRTQSGAAMGSPPGPAQIQEMQRCIQERSLAVSTMPPSSGPRVTSGNNARLPMMISSNGNPKLYARYEICGPVVIAQMNKGANGKLSDISQVLFDPDWIARQPAFAFKSKSGKGGTKIDF